MRPFSGLVLIQDIERRFDQGYFSLVIDESVSPKLNLMKSFLLLFLLYFFVKYFYFFEFF